ncbi:unnamed protein product [Scytosiphon promiscuus]
MEHPLANEIGGVKFEVGDTHEVLGLLGQGSFGIVAAGLEIRTGKKVAIKRIHPIADSLVRARHVLREVITLRVLRCHPNIINVEDIRLDAQSGTLYIFVELMECDLRRVLASGRVLTTGHVQALLKQLLLGVHAMHCHDILHRDLKPANILLLHDGQLRITDFGLSGQTKLPSPVTKYGVTSWYGAPEMILESKGGDGKPLDMWSVGCILGEMLGSRGPLFPGKNQADQVSLMLAAVGKVDTARKYSLGYELGENAVALLRAVKRPTGRLLEGLVPSEVDGNAFDLLKALLDINTQRRITAGQALEHFFLRYCPRLPTADDARGTCIPAVGTPVERVDDGAVDFSFEDDSFDVAEFGRLIAAEVTFYEKSKHKSYHNRILDATVSPPLPSLRPAPSLQDYLRVVHAHARCHEGSEDEVSRKAEHDAIDSDFSVVRHLRAGSMSSPGAALDPRFSSMANLADAEGHRADALRRFLSSDMGPELQMGSVAVGSATKNPRVVDSDSSGLTSDCLGGGKQLGAEVGEVKLTQVQDGGIGIARAPPQQQQARPRPSLPPKRSGNQLDGRKEEERAAFVIQRSHRQAAAIRRARAKQEQSLQTQQFLFGPGFQQPTCRTARRSGGDSGRHSERRERNRDKASLTPSEEDAEGEKRNSRAATKIQAHARRKAASRRGEKVASVPRLPIESSALFTAFSFRRFQTATPKAQREPLAILRQLRDDPDVQPAPKTDQFRLRMTIKSAIKAHIKKNGRPRRKPHPLPTALTYRQNAALMKLKAQQQQQQLRAEATRIPLTKRRAASPLHRSVRQVNTFIASTDKGRGRRATGPGPRAQSAPPNRATDRLRCAIYAAETMVEREYERSQRRPSLLRDGAPVDEVSRELLARPLLVPFSAPG